MEFSRRRDHNSQLVETGRRKEREKERKSKETTNATY
jgi:hypothetical protein